MYRLYRYMNTYMCRYTCIYIYAHTDLSICVCMDVEMYISMFIYPLIYVCIYIHTDCMCIYIYIYVNTDAVVEITRRPVKAMEDCAKFDFQSLLHAMADDVAAQRAEVATAGHRALLEAQKPQKYIRIPIWHVVHGFGHMVYSNAGSIGLYLKAHGT